MYMVSGGLRPTVGVNVIDDADDPRQPGFATDPFEIRRPIGSASP